MKKKYIVITTLVALIISLSLFAASVIAAVRVNFGINNTITFVGGNKNMAFEVNAKIYGTTLGDENQAPSHTWVYDYDKSNTTELDVWNVGDIEFDSEDKDDIKIIYEFIINNTGNAGDYKISACIVPLEIDSEDLQEPVITGTESNPIIIDVGGSDSIKLELRPETTEGFSGKRTCNFTVKIEPIT